MSPWRMSGSSTFQGRTGNRGGLDPRRFGGRRGVGAWMADGCMALALLAVVWGAWLWNVPDSAVTAYPDSAGYQAVAQMVRAGDGNAVAQPRAVLYPAVLALQQITGMPHYALVMLVNVLGVGLLVVVLRRRGMTGTAVATVALGAVLMLSGKQQYFAGGYLREAIMPGLTGLHLALVTVAVTGAAVGVGRVTRFLYLALALLVAYHFKGIYLYVFGVAGLLLLVPVLATPGDRIPGPVVRVRWPGWLGYGVGVVAWLLVVGGVWASNPHNDANLRGMTLLGALLNSPLPVDAVGPPDDITGMDRERLIRMAQWMIAARARDVAAGQEGARLDPFRYEADHRRQFGTSAAAGAAGLYRAAALHHGGTGLWTLADRTQGLWRSLWATTEHPHVCSGPLRNTRGLPVNACLAVAWPTAVAWFLVPLMVLAGWAGTRRVSPQAVGALGLLATSLGLTLILGLVSYTAIWRLAAPSLAYGVLALPLVLRLLGPEVSGGKRGRG